MSSSTSVHTQGTGDSAPLTTYHFAVLRLVPHVHVGTFIPIGVIVHARSLEFLGIKVITDLERLRQYAPEVDCELLVRYLQACEAIAKGDPKGGPVALSPPSERFHWLTAPRSDVLQSSAVHEGVSSDPAKMLDRLFAMYVGEELKRASQ
jgi:hypothetical protein